MLNILLKYDLKHMLKRISAFYILSIFFAILTRIFLSIDSSMMVKIIGKVCSGCTISMIANILINVMLQCWLRFRDSIYKDEGYLTHTLPVSKNDIYNSKFILTLILFIISFLIILISLFIAYYTKTRWLLLKGFITKASTGLDFNITTLIIGFLAVIFLEIFNAIQCGYFGIILGYKRSNSKMAWSILLGFVAYLIAQSVVLFLVFVIGLFNSSIMDLFKTNVVINPSAFKLLMYISIIFYIVVITAMNVLCKKIFKTGVNLE